MVIIYNFVNHIYDFVIIHKIDFLDVRRPFYSLTYLFVSYIDLIFN